MMVTRIGTVVAVLRGRVRVAVAGKAKVLVENQAPSACCRPTEDAGEAEVEATSRAALRLGDRVEVLVPEPRGLGARLAPLLPAVVLPIVGAIAGGLVWGDAGTGIGIGGGLLLGIAAAVLLGRRAGGGSSGGPRVLRLVEAAATGGHCAACSAAAKGR